jgi:predicted RNA binding protein YcfA (HicA-like mRNA interferase family)
MLLSQSLEPNLRVPVRAVLLSEVSGEPLSICPFPVVMQRELAKLGCTFEQGTRHLIVRYQGERTLMPRHPSQEIQTGILKKLGIQE